MQTHHQCLEITELRLKPGTPYDSPSLLANLRTIRSQLSTNSRFYLGLDDISQLFIFGLWESREAHSLFLESSESRRILGPQEHQTEFIRAWHMLVHSMEELPLDAPVMHFVCDVDKIRDISHPPSLVDAFKEREDAFNKRHQRPYPLLRGMDLDMEPPKHLTFTGWESKAERLSFLQERRKLSTSDQDSVDPESFGEVGEGRVAVHLTDLEKMIEESENKGRGEGIGR